MRSISIYNHPHRFRLYLSGHTPISQQTLADVRELCRNKLPGRHHIEIVDVLRHPDRAFREGITMTPALVRLEPTPIKKIVVTSGPTGAVIETLELEKITE